MTNTFIIQCLILFALAAIAFFCNRKLKKTTIKINEIDSILSLSYLSYKEKLLKIRKVVNR